MFSVLIYVCQAAALGPLHLRYMEGQQIAYKIDGGLKMLRRGITEENKRNVKRERLVRKST